MDQGSLVTIGREAVAELQRQGFKFLALLWAREDYEQKWQLWVVPRTYKGSRDFYTAISQVLANLGKRSVYLDISDVRPIEPNSMIAIALQRYGRVRPDFPVRLYSENLGGSYVGEALLLYHDI